MGFERVEIGAERLQVGVGEAFRLQACQPLAQASSAEARSASPAYSSSCEARVRAIGELVHDRLRVGPDPGQRPQQAAEDERQQAERANRLELRVVALVRDLLRQDVHHPEQGDEHDRHDEEDEEGDELRQRVFGFRREERGVRASREEQQEGSGGDQLTSSHGSGVVSKAAAVPCQRVRRGVENLARVPTSAFDE